MVDIDHEAKSIGIVDYKTGKPSISWTGKTDFEKIKLHKYRQQLMFYKLLVEHSRDYSHLAVDQASLQFVEPTNSGSIVELTIEWSSEELERFAQLVQAVWQSIISLDFPDISSYSTDYKGIQAFENDLLAAFIEK